MGVCCPYLRLWQAVAGEVLGVFLINLTLGAITSQLDETETVDVFLYSIFYASITIAMTLSMRHVSGGHLNPAITTAMIVSRRINIGRAALYFIAQCSGAVMGSGVIFAITRHKTVGMTRVNERLDIAQAFGMETMGTFVYVFSYFTAMDRHRKADGIDGSATLLAASFISATIFARPYTGGSLNPARSLGPAVIENNWDKHWVFWLGPLVGGSVGGFLYDLLFAGNATPRRALSYISDTDYNPDLIYRPKTQIHGPLNISTTYARRTYSSRSDTKTERGVRKMKSYRDQRSRSPSHIGADESYVTYEKMASV